MSNICFIVRLFPVFLMELKFSECFFPMKTDACNSRRPKHSTYSRMFVAVLCCIFWEDWSNIFRTRSFTLCKNDLDSHDMSDSVTVSESISSSSTINLSVCCANTTSLPFLLPSLHQISTLEKNIFRQHSVLSSLMSRRPWQVSPFWDAAKPTSSEVIDFHFWFSLGFVMQ